MDLEKVLLITTLIVIHFILWVSYIYTYYIEARLKSKKLFTVTIPEVKKRKNNVVAIVDTFKEKVKKFIIAMFVTTLFYLIPISFENKLTYLILAGFIPIFLLCKFAKEARGQILFLKNQENWELNYPDEYRIEVKGNIYQENDFNEDEHWRYTILGPMYSNPKDPRTIVDVKGGNIICNMARPAIKIMLGVTLGGTVLLLSYLFIYPAILDHNHKLAELTIKNNELVVESPLYSYQIPISSIENIGLINRIPDGTRTFGTATGTYSTGNFRLNTYGKCKMYIASKHKVYIVIETNNGIVIVNDDEENKTQEVYEELSELIK